MSKSKVLSVRLSLESLQSCFDLCEALGNPTNGASGAIARSIEILTKDLRAKGSLPTYKTDELKLLVESFVAKKNPTSMMNLEALSNFESIDRREMQRDFKAINHRAINIQGTQTGRFSSSVPNASNSDFAPLETHPDSRLEYESFCDGIEACEADPKERTWQESHDESTEYAELLEEQIQIQVKQEEEDLLAKILMG